MQRIFLFLLFSLFITSIEAQTGKIGVNTIEPSERFEVRDGSIEISGIGFTNAKGIKFSETTNPLFGWIYNGINNRLHLREYFSDSANVFSINSSGLVGIGLDNPLTLLDISKGNSFQFRINNPLTGGDDWFIGSSDQSWNMGGGKFAISTDGSSGNTAFMIDPDKRIGIGTFSPSSKVQIDGTSGEDPFRVRMNGITKVLVHDNGGISIGTTSTPEENGLRMANFAGSSNRNVYSDAQGNLKNNMQLDSLIFGPSSFHVENDTDQSVTINFVIVDREGSAFCPLHKIPNGAIIQKIAMNFYDDTNEGDARIRLYSKEFGLTGSFSELFFDPDQLLPLATISSIGAQDLWRISEFTTPGITIDKSNKSYALSFTMENDENPTNDGVWLNGVKIVYLH